MRELKNSYWCIGCDPSRGSALAFGDVSIGGKTYALLGSAAARKDAPHVVPEASFLMAPWSNRLRQGKVRINDEEFLLSEPKTHALHGCLHPTPWEVVSHEKTSLLCRIEVPGKTNAKKWPFAFAAEYRITLVGRALKQTLTLENTSPVPQPLGGGFHPYFSRHIAKSCRGEVRLDFPLEGVYPCAGEPCLPTGMPVHDRDKLAVMAGKKLLKRSFFLDDCFSGFSGEGKISWESEGIALRFSCGEGLGHIVCYNPDAAVFALEPVSHCNDAYNLAPEVMSPRQAGVVSVAPGETRVLQFDMTVEHDKITY